MSKTFFTRSAIVAAIIYDTRKDSDGGAWRKRCQATSWYNEALNGKYLGEAASAAAAWALSGAVTGSFYYDTTNGNFWTLGASSPAVTQTYRGNRAEFPEVVAITVEAGNQSTVPPCRVNIWDLTDSSVPMFMSFVGTNSGWATRIFASIIMPILSSVCAVNGKVIVGGDANIGLTILDFIRDVSVGYTQYSNYGGLNTAGLGNRNTSFNGNRGPASNAATIINTTVNSIAATVLPTAPIDSATGLPVPTIYCYTSGGLSIIKDDGTVSNVTLPSATYQNSGGVLNGKYAISGRGTKADFGQRGVAGKDLFYDYPMSSWYTALTDLSTTTVLASWGVGNTGYGPQSSVLNLIKPSYSAITTSLFAVITNTYNSGWMNGDIRGAWLADTTLETVSGTELVTNGTFTETTPGAGDGLRGWTGVGLSWNAGGAIDLLSTVGVGAYSDQMISTVIGKSYTISVNKTNAPTVGGGLYIRVGTSSGAYQHVNMTSLGGAAANTTFTYQFIATTTTTYIRLYNADAAGGVLTTLDNISVTECAADRSVKANPMTVVGTLTKSAVNTGSQLVAYSGFAGGATPAYLEQAYSANLDYTADFSKPIWIYPTSTQTSTILTRSPATLAGNSYALNLVAGVINLGRSIAGAAFANTTFGYTPPLNAWTLIQLVKSSGVIYLKVNGVRQATTVADTNSYVNTSAVFTVGVDNTHNNPFLGSLCWLKSSATALSDDQAAYWFESERKAFEPYAKVTIDGTSTAVTTLAYDEVTDMLDVGTSWGRSTFKGLVRQSSDATTNGAAVSYAAYDGNRVTVGATGAKLYIPSKYLRDELNRAAEQKKQFGQELLQYDFDAIAAQTTFTLPLGFAAKFVYVAGVKKRFGSTKDYTISNDGFRDTVTLAVAPGAAAWVSVLYTRTIV